MRVSGNEKLWLLVCLRRNASFKPEVVNLKRVQESYF